MSSKETRTKIALIITSTGWGGLEMNVLKLVGWLSDNYSISLITQQQSTIYEKGRDAFSDTLLLDRHKKYFDFKSARKIAGYLKEQNIPLVIVCDNKDIDVISWVKRIYMRSLKVIYHQQMQIGISKKDPLHTFRFRAIDCWISPLQYLKDEVGRCTGFPTSRVEVIPLCLEVDRFLEKKFSKEKACEKLGIPVRKDGLQKPLLGIVGRIDPKKGQLFLVEAIPELRRRGLEVEVLVFGSATVNEEKSRQYEREIHRFVSGNQLEEVVHFVPHRPDVELFYQAIDVFVLGSHSETFGMVTIEAMLSELPIVATESGGTSEILDNGKLGLLYPFENQEKFCNQVQHLLNHPEQSSEMAGRAREVAAKAYNHRVEKAGFERVIKNLLSGHKG